MPCVVHEIPPPPLSCTAVQPPPPGIDYVLVGEVYLRPYAIFTSRRVRRSDCAGIASLPMPPDAIK